MQKADMIFPSPHLRSSRLPDRLSMKTMSLELRCMVLEMLVLGPVIFVYCVDAAITGDDLLTWLAESEKTCITLAGTTWREVYGFCIC
mmetsp:Transcript_8482/g.13805  ORF Transcript_8482/g.13805 Transcript_8482/m.13805 type:complete len:88 (+) Transcript_8482:186-449(+)